MTAPAYELGRVAYEAHIKGHESERLPWSHLSSWVQSHWARIELASRKAEVADSERRWAAAVSDAEAGRTSPTALYAVKK